MAWGGPQALDVLLTVWTLEGSEALTECDPDPRAAPTLDLLSTGPHMTPV